jgi:hypothetical protein
MRQVGCVPRSQRFSVQVQLHIDRRDSVQTELVGPQNTPCVWVDHCLNMRGAKIVAVGHRSYCVNVVRPRWRSHKSHVSHGGAMRQVGCVPRSQRFSVQVQLHFDRRDSVQTELVGPQNTPCVWVDHCLNMRGAKIVAVCHRSYCVNVVRPRWRSHKCHVSQGGAMRQVGCVPRSQRFSVQIQSHFDRRDSGSN